MRRAVLIGASILGVSLGAVAPANAQPAPYPAPSSMVPFLFANPDDEIALAKSAAPRSISDDAEVWTLTSQGYQTAIQGKNGFVCFVDRGWTKPFDDPEFWSPKVRAPQCANAAAARCMLPIVRERAAWVMARLSKEEIVKRTRAEVAAHVIPRVEAGNMVYMMSKAGFISEVGEPHWHPHVMFYFPMKDLPFWGADQEGVPVVRSDNEAIGITTYFVLTSKWSDGSSAIMDMKPATN